MNILYIFLYFYIYIIYKISVCNIRYVKIIYLRNINIFIAI